MNAMSPKTEQRLNAALAIASLVGVIWVGYVVTSGVQYRREMACRDHWDHRYSPEECAKVLKEALPAPKTKDARVLL
jgi:hypothetical protein